MAKNRLNQNQLSSLNLGSSSFTGVLDGSKIGGDLSVQNIEAAVLTCDTGNITTVDSTSVFASEVTTSNINGELAFTPKNYTYQSRNRVLSFDCDNPAGFTFTGTVTHLGGTNNNPGVFRIESASAQYSQARLVYGSYLSPAPFFLDHFKRLSIIFKYDSVTDIQGWFGLYGGGGPTGDHTQNNSIVAFINNSTLSLRTNTTTSTNHSTTGSILADTWYRIDLIRESTTSVSMSLNGTKLVTVSSGLPSGVGCGFGGRLMTLANPGAKVWFVDYIEAIFENTSNRY